MIELDPSLADGVPEIGLKGPKSGGVGEGVGEGRQWW